MLLMLVGTNKNFCTLLSCEFCQSKPLSMSKSLLLHVKSQLKRLLYASFWEFRNKVLQEKSFTIHPNTYLGSARHNICMPTNFFMYFTNISRIWFTTSYIRSLITCFFADDGMCTWRRAASSRYNQWQLTTLDRYITSSIHAKSPPMKSFVRKIKSFLIAS